MSVHLAGLNAGVGTEVVSFLPGEVNPFSPDGAPETCTSIMFCDGEDAVVLAGTHNEIQNVLARAIIALHRLR